MQSFLRAGLWASSRRISRPAEAQSPLCAGRVGKSSKIELFFTPKSPVRGACGREGGTVAYLTYKFFARVARRQRGDDENRRKRKSPPCARGMWALQRSGVSLARPKPLARGASGRQSPLRAGHVVKGYRKGFRIDLAPQSPCAQGMSAFHPVISQTPTKVPCARGMSRKARRPAKSRDGRPASFPFAA